MKQFGRITLFCCILHGGDVAAQCTNYNITVTAGTFPGEVSWQFQSAGGTIVANGGASMTVPICVVNGCYTMLLFDSWGDGWNGATWTITTSGGAVVQSGTLNSGSYGQATVPLGVPGSECASSGAVTASDCADAVNVCTNFSFQIDPNGSGNIVEIPPPGSFSNPSYTAGDFILSPWGTDNTGCLLSGELNSTWMIVNIWGGGILEFTFGGLGTQAGFYDWIMYPFTPTSCASVAANQLAPIRCNWNGVSYGGTGLAAVTPPGGDPSNYETPLLVTAGQRYLICFSNWSSVTTNVPLQFGGTAVVDCQVLPIELLSLNATDHATHVLLEWATATESGSDSFIIERSDGNGNWAEIGKVPAAQTSLTLQLYAFEDMSPGAGANYYRLKLLDLNGTYEHSEVVSVHRNLPGPVLFPNPNKGEFHLRMTGENIEVKVHDQYGREMAIERMPAGDGLIKIVLDAPDGSYLLHARTGQHSTTDRIVVAR